MIIRVPARLLQLVCMSFLTVFLFCNSASAQFAGGSGTEAEPYEVATLEQLQLIADTLYLDKHFIQTDNIDAGETATWYDGLGFDPIGWMAFEQDSFRIDIIGEPFTGTYNGNGFIIKDLTINREDVEFIGLFGYVEKGVLRNITLENVHVTGLSSVGGLVGRNLGFIENSIAEGFVTGKGRTVGGLVGSNDNNRGLVDTQEWIRGEISSSSAAGQVSGAYRVGGLTGWNAGSISGSNATSNVSGKNEVGGFSGVNGATITASFATGSVTGENYAGGLIGINAGQAGRIFPFEGIVRDTYATGNVSGNSIVGGLIGYSWRGEVHNSHATGRIISEDGSAGGLIAQTSGCSIYSSYSTGDVSGKRFVGGLIGNSLGVQLKSSFAEGHVSGTKWVGGLTGSGSGIISNTYARGNVSGDTLVGGLMGSSSGEISSSYASGDVSGSYRVGGLVGEMDYDRGASLSQSYWDQEATNRNEAVGNKETDGATGFSTEQMTGQNAWVFMREFDFEQTWQLTEGYPALYWEQPDSVLEAPQAAILQVHPREERGYDFGEVGISEADTTTIMLFNSGNVAMQGELNLSGPDAAHFGLGLGAAPEFTLAPGDSLIVEVVFSPQEADTLQAALVISHNAPNKLQPLSLQLSGKGEQTTSADGREELPQAFELHQNYPNPFNPVTTISYDLPENADVRLEIFDMLGRRVAVLVSETQNPGTYQISWDASDVASGFYIYRFRAGEFVQTRTMMLVK